MRRRGEHSDTWGAFQLRYVSYRKRPFWSTMVRVPDSKGHLAPSDLKYRREEGLRAAARVTEAIHRLKERDPKFPSQPSRFG